MIFDNLVILKGNLASDVLQKDTKTGKLMASFVLAVDRGKDKGTDFFSITSFDKEAEIALNYLNKGDKIRVFAKAKQSNFKKNGNEIKTIDFISQSFEFFNKKEVKAVKAGNFNPAEY